MIGFDPLYLLMIAPALLLAMWAQARIHSAYRHGMEEPAALSGAAAARHILDQAGLTEIPIEEVPGDLSDHYDPRQRVVRLSTAVYRSRSCAAVGIAAHECGHALQHAYHYAPLVIRNAAVPAAIVGPNLSVGMMFLGVVLGVPMLILAGIGVFAAVAAFQLINLPVEFDASARAKRILNELQIVDPHGASVVSGVLNAAAWTYVAATLQTLLTLLYYVIRFSGALQRRDD